MDMELREAGEDYDSLENAERVAKERGLIVVAPKPDELFIDLDCDEDFQEFRKRLADFNSQKLGFVLRIERLTPSASGPPHYHAVVKISDADFLEPEQVILTDERRILLQFLLGSDRVREILSVYRMLRQDDRPPTLFFERP